MNEVIKELIQMVKNLSPELWRILLKQVEVELYQSIFSTSILFLASFILFFLVYILRRLIYKENKKLEESYEDSSYKSSYTRNEIKDKIEGLWVGFWGLIFIGLVVFCISASGISKMIGYYMNPEFYAVQILISQIK